MERKTLTNTLRTIVQKELGKPVIFKIEQLIIKDGWAFLRGVPLQPSGKAMEYRGTPYQQQIDAGIFDDWFCALLQKQHGKWRVLKYAIGATDAPFADWSQQYQAPSDIFKE